ncbi:uncharacterized protein CEXT_655821 [Caerostris extrusa]|uniref:Uncharacterized protein n=1 Tax=Caerostris extrusa TaxID=172846 RepID=A0AAV4WH71_CAEEX|nr:uncharacterized protein CEXT_655821 [Caerostris extrusa]
MFSPRLFCVGVLFLMFSYEASAMDCSAAGVMFSCPTAMNDRSEIFCCSSSLSSSLQVCCNVEEFLKQNTGILVGILVVIIAILIIITLCCCCFCSCCCLAKRRLNRGTVLYGPMTTSVSANYPPSTYQVVHAPPPSQASSPPPYYPANPNYAYQPPANPNYK